MTMIKKHDLASLETLYQDAESCDSEIFSEMRSNLLLISGEHYTRRQSAFFKRVRDSKELSDQQKLRLTKNHIQKIVKSYCNNILALAPGVGFEPKNAQELQDQKAAELHHAVWQDAKEKYNLDELLDDWADDFVGIGEVAVKIFFDPNGGTIKAFNQEVDESGLPIFDEMGSPKKGEPIYAGEFVFETVHGFNLLRPSECKDMRKAPYLAIRKMMDKAALIEKYPDNKGKITESADDTIVVFDNAKSGYRKSQDEVMVKEYYFRPCPQYPEGYFFITTREVVLAEGTLPGGIFPIVFQPFDKIQTTPRGRSPVKIMRPYQAEINRAASKIAEHHITLGDDKLLIQNGTKISAGVALPGVRSINFTGMQPEILAGRDGSQYLAYMQAQIVELYQVLNVTEDALETQAGQLDPYALLFRSASQKKKFQRYIKRFERFLVEVAKTYIQLAKIHLDEDAFVLAVGRNERVNIAEFKNSEDLCYQIKIDAQSDDIETKMGKQLVLNHLVQYTGTKLDKQDIGKLVRLMPYANMEEGFSDLTLDYDSGTNDILALDRGDQPPAHEYDDHMYMVKRLVARMRQPDFTTLNPEIQQNYVMRVQQHQQYEVQHQQQIQQAAQGYIPTGGYLVKCDFYTGTDPKDSSKVKRVSLPYESLRWLVERLEAQGASLDELEKMNQGAVAQMAATMIQQKQMQGAAQGNGLPAPGGQPDGMGRPGIN